MAECAQVTGEVAAAQLQPGKIVTFTDSIATDTQQQNAAGFATYAVESQNSHGRSAGLSNQVEVPLAPTFAAPQLNARITGDGPEVSWRPVVGCVAGGETACSCRVR